MKYNNSNNYFISSNYYSIINLIIIFYYSNLYTYILIIKINDNMYISIQENT